MCCLTPKAPETGRALLPPPRVALPTRPSSSSLFRKQTKPSLGQVWGAACQVDLLFGLQVDVDPAQHQVGSADLRAYLMCTIETAVKLTPAGRQAGGRHVTDLGNKRHASGMTPTASSSAGSTSPDICHTYKQQPQEDPAKLLTSLPALHEL